MAEKRKNITCKHGKLKQKYISGNKYTRKLTFDKNMYKTVQTVSKT